MRPRLALIALIVFLSSLAVLPVYPQFRRTSNQDRAAARFDKQLRVLKPERGDVPNQLVIKLAPGADRRAVSALHAAAGARVVSEIPQIGVQTLLVPNIPGTADPYRKSALVRWAEPNNYRYPLVLDPNDTYYNTIDFDTELPYKWDAHHLDGVAGWSIWPNQYFTAAGGKGTKAVRIAVIDTGIDYTHPDFRNAGGASSNVTDGGQLLRSLDRSILNGTTTADAPDEYGHGTHVTGIAAAGTNNNGTGVTGVGYNAQVLSVRVADAQGNGTETDVAQAIVYAADNGAVICNISLGGYDYSQAEQDAVNYAWGKGMLVIAAAGNDGTHATPNYPAALSRVLAVSATARNDVLALYSNYGNYIAAAAPGGDWDFEIGDTGWFLGIYSTMPTYNVTLNGPDYGAAMNYEYLQGTSMAAPQVTGLAALYAGQKGITQSTTNGHVSIWQALQRGAVGPGGWNQYYGFGRISVYDTLNLDSVPNPRGDTVGCVIGQVRYKDTPVQNASVQAIPVNGGTTFSASSRDDGTYRISNAASGTYNVKATYIGESQTLNNVVVTAGCDIPAVDFNISSSPPPANYTLTVSATSVETGSPLSVSWSAPAGSSTKDWIALYKVGTDNRAYLWWTYTDGATSGIKNLTAPTQTGDYEFRYLLNNGFTSVATSSKVTVTPTTANYTVTASASSVAAGAPLSVSWTAPTGTSTRDWIGLFKVGTDNRSYVWWAYTNGTTTGTHNLTAPMQTGDYEFRYLLNNGYTSAASSQKVTVSQPSSNYTLTPSVTSVLTQEPLSVSWTAPAGASTKDWIALYKVGTNNQAYVWWGYTNGATSGTLNLTAPTQTGDYEFRYLLNNGYTSVATSAKVTVSAGSAYSVTPSATNVAAGAALSVNWTAPSTAELKDWIGLFRLGDPYTAYVWWTYTGGTTSGSASLTAPSTPGNYEFRYYHNNGGLEKARSQTVVVN